MTRAVLLPFGSAAEVLSAEVRFRWPGDYPALYADAEAFLAAPSVEALLRMSVFFAPRGVWRLRAQLCSMETDVRLRQLADAAAALDLARQGAWGRALDALVRLPGVAYPMASGLVMAARRGDFPVIGEAPLAACGHLGMKAPGRKLSIEFVSQMFSGAWVLETTMRPLDHALWAVGIERMRDTRGQGVAS